MKKRSHITGAFLVLTLTLVNLMFVNIKQVNALPFIHNSGEVQNADVMNTDVMVVNPAQTPVVDQKKILNKVNKAWRRYLDVKAASFDFTMNADFQYPEELDYMGKVKFRLALTGNIDLKQADNPKLNLKFDAKSAVTYSTELVYQLAGNLKLNQGKLFAQLTTADMPSYGGEDEMKAILNKWWKITLPSEFIQELAKNSNGLNAQNLTAAEKSYLQAFRNAKLFSKIKYVDTQKVMGENSDHYSAMLNKSALLSLLTRSHQLRDSSGVFSTSDLKGLKDYLKENNLSIEIYIGQTSGILNKMLIKFPVKSDSSYSPSGNITLELALGDFDKSITVDTPSKAEEIPTENLLNTLLGF